MDLRPFAVALASAVLASVAYAGDGPPLSIPVGPNSVGACSGAEITPTLIVQGQFPFALMGSYVMLPFEVPEGTTQVRVKYCWEPKDGPNAPSHTVDLGIWSARGEAQWGEPEFRGWGGSSHPDVAISEQGFSTEQQYLDTPKGYFAGRTTRGFLPGPIEPGTWAVELGVGAVVSQAEGDEDGLTDWRVEIELSSDPAFAAEPYEPATYDATPANPDPGWYAGDLHVHGEHSALGNATMTDVFDYAFAPIGEGAGLDFISLTDYVTSSAWGEIGRYQAAHPGKLIVRGSEIITYHGHCMNHASAHYVDHRTGPVYELAGDGTLTTLRASHPPAEIFAEVQANGGFTQINHPTHCPSDSAYCRRTCRGCPWDYSTADSGYADVDGIEVQSGSLFMYSLWNATALQFWEAALESIGGGIAAIGVSDSHTAGVVGDAQSAPIGDATTVVYAPELSESGILAGVRAAHTYVKLFGNDGPDLRLDGHGDHGGDGIMGDTISGPGADLTATVFNLDPEAPTHTLRLMQNGVGVEAVDVDPPGGEHVFRAGTEGRYYVRLEQPDGTIVALTSELTVPEPEALAGAATALLALAARRYWGVGSVRTWKKPKSIVWNR
jgi:hypothetical protein